MSALFVAVTVTVAMPGPTPATVSIAPSTETVAMASDEDIAEYTSAVPENAPLRSTWAVSSTNTDMGSIASANSGGMSMTSNSKVRSVVPAALVAPTVTVTVPCATPTSVRVESSTDTVACVSNDDIPE